jgi:hypothetical protein
VANTATIVTSADARVAHTGCPATLQTTSPSNSASPAPIAVTTFEPHRGET